MEEEEGRSPGVEEEEGRAVTFLAEETTDPEEKEKEEDSLPQDLSMISNRNVDS